MLKRVLSKDYWYSNSLEKITWPTLLEIWTKKSNGLEYSKELKFDIFNKFSDLAKSRFSKDSKIFE